MSFASNPNKPRTSIIKGSQRKSVNDATNVPLTMQHQQNHQQSQLNPSPLLMQQQPQKPTYTHVQQVTTQQPAPHPQDLQFNRGLLVGHLPGNSPSPQPMYSPTVPAVQAQEVREFITPMQQIGPQPQQYQATYQMPQVNENDPQISSPYYGNSLPPVTQAVQETKTTSPPTGTYQETKNVHTTSTSIVSMPLSQTGSATSGLQGSGISARTGDSDDTRISNAYSKDEVPGRITDTEIRVKITGDLPLWYIQQKPKMAKYTKHMMHLFLTGVCAFVGKTNVYFLKVKFAEQGETLKHIKITYSQILFVKIAPEKKLKPLDHSDHHKKKSPSYYCFDEGDVMIKTGHKGETHVLIDHFAQQKTKPTNCSCKDPKVACKCMLEARSLVMHDPASYTRFTGTTGC